MISTVTDPLIRVSYLGFGILCLLGLLSIGISIMVSDTIGDTNVASVNAVIFLLFWGSVTLLAARSIKRLRRLKIDKIDITLHELVGSMHPTSAQDKAWFTASQVLKSAGVTRFFVIAVGLLLIYSGVEVYMRSMIEEMTFNQFGSPLPQHLRFVQGSQNMFWAGACYFALKARAKLQPTAEGVLSMDRRTPVLFLRSFVDDERVRFLYAQKTLFDFSLEARLASHFFKTGPFIAVDSPNHTPAIGAARASLPDNEWQGKVMDWMGAGRLIVIVLLAGLTQWVRWEMRQIVGLGYTQKLIILMPELSGWKHRKRRLRSDIARKRFEVIRETFSSSPWEAGINEPSVPENIRSLMFEPGGQVTAVCAKSRSRDCYQLAALISEYLIRKAQAQITTLSAA